MNAQKMRHNQMINELLEKLYKKGYRAQGTTLLIADNESDLEALQAEHYKRVYRKQVNNNHRKWIDEQKKKGVIKGLQSDFNFIDLKPFE